MKDSTQNMVLMAMFVAITMLLGLTPIGLIPLGFINVTILCVPVILGTILLGLNSGLILGACFGLASTMSAFGLSMTPPSALASALAVKNPFLAIVMCFGPRLLVPVITHLVYRLMAKIFSRKQAVSPQAVPVAAVCGSLTNTIFYLGLMLLFYNIVSLDSTKLMAIITGTGLIAGGLEAVVAAVIASPVAYAIWKVQRKVGTETHK